MKNKLSGKSSVSITIVLLLLFISILTSVTAIPHEDFPYTEPGEFAITPDGKHAYINNDKAFIMAPAEIHGSGWTYLNFTSKQYSGDIDLALGFDTTHLAPEKAEFYKPHFDNYTRDYTIYNVTGVFYERTDQKLDVGNEYNFYNGKHWVMEYYQPNYNYSQCDPIINNNCTPDNYSIEALVVAFDSISPSPPIIEGNNYTITYHNKRIVNWIDITDKLSVLPESIHNNYDGKNKWYYVKDQSIIAETEYQIRIDVYAPPQLGEHTYKYDVVIKPSSQDFSTANTNGNLFILDPYWNTSFSNRLPITITTSGTSAPENYQVLLNISYEPEMQPDFDDIRFTNSSNGEIAYWNLSKVDSSYANVWVNLSDVITDPGSDIVWMYYGNDAVSSGSDGDGTFIQYHGSATTDYLDSLVVTPSNIAYESKIKVTSSTHNNLFGLVNIADISDDGMYFQLYDNGDLRRGYTENENVNTVVVESPDVTINSYVKLKFTHNGTTVHFYIDDNEIESGSSTNLPDEDLGLFLWNPSGTCVQDWSFVRKYINNEPTASYGTTQYHIDSLHYNTSTPYNITIESDSTLTSNRSIISGDDINDTAQSTGTSYLIINDYDNAASIVRNFTFTGDNLDWYQVANISGTYDLKNSSGIIETQSNGNFTTDLTAGTYWIEEEVGGYITPTPTSLANTTGNFWVNYTWSAGAGNVTDLYNVSYNDTWDNSSSNTYRNESVGTHGYLDIVVYAYNNTGNALSAGYVTDNVTVPNNVPTQSSSHTNLSTHVTDHTPAITWTEGTDADGDTVTTYVYVGTTSTPTDVEGSTTDETLDLGSVVTLSDGVTYYWRTRSHDGYVYSDYTDTDEFRMNTPPVVSNLQTDGQTNGTNLINLTPLFTWDYADNESDVQMSYAIDVGTEATGDASWDMWEVDLNNTADSFARYNGSELSYDTTYYVNMRCRDTDGIEWSDSIYGTFVILSPNYIPPVPVIDSITTGNFWVNTTWTPGAGNITNAYNSTNGTTWVNNTLNYRNTTLSAHTWQNLTVYSYNSSGTGTLSLTTLTNNTQVPNNAISISGVSASYTINEGETLFIDANYSDTDSDTGTVDDNSTVWNVDANTGIVSWVTSNGDNGIYNWYINVSDGYGSIDTQEFAVTVNDSIYTPELAEVSFSPSPFNTNYTGVITISYLVKSSEPLNLSSLAFTYGINYTITSDMQNYISTPENTIAYDGLYRAPHRNLTPYLSWEDNNTITEGNVWKWGGYDNDSAQLSTSVVNSTHTWVNVTGYTETVLPSSHYISKTEMFNSPKTGFEINRAQGLIFKIWNVEEIRNRDSNYFSNLYFDTSWESTLPTYPIEIGFCNDSYNPSVDDIDTSPYCAKFGEWNGTRWVDHSFDPGVNASYASPLVINASLITSLSPDDTNYIWLRSYTLTSKSFVLNATNHDPGITNITYAQTNTMWTYNELNGQTEAVAYTPSFFTTFVRNDEEMLHQLYVANNVGDWGQTGILTETIGVSSVPVPAVSFEHFNVSCSSGYLNDTLMDSTYNDGTIDIYIHAPADPDGGIVSHNLTLHYGNETFVAIINNTFTTTGTEYVTIDFSTASYYSSSDYYTLKCVSTDNEGSVATKWLVSNFTLDADGNQGHITNGKVDFWGMDDIPTLYTAVGNSSLISYNAGTDIYTMHVPFFKSKYNDTFNFNETVYLKSLNNEDVAYFRFTGDTVFDYTNIYAWNTTSSTFAPVTDTHRGYVYSHLCTHGNITNSVFSYLGSDLYRQEGLNFIETTRDYLIHNTTFSHNAEGPIMENCANFTISNSTISNNVNVGIGVYFTNDTIIENNSISYNGGRGVSIYEGHNNLINYNTITNNGEHGIHMWSNSINNTCTGNDITGSTTYDYYLSSSSTDNYIIDPASTTDKVRVTSTSSLNIENTDNSAFSEDSLNTSYAYLTNFSMYVTGVSQTFDITQHNVIISPSTDKLSIWNLEWDDTLNFNASSDTALNPTWFNITNTSWSSSVVNISINGTVVTTENTDVNGLLTYNYTDTYSEKWFEFQLYGSIPSPTPTETPTATSTPPPSGGSSSGTGTTGVGTSDEPLYNIDCRETGKIRNLQAGTETYYRTTKLDCTNIIKVTFTPTQNSPEQPILIEKLHNISRFVTTPAPGITYSNFNLYVGLFGYDSKTSNEKILFKVSKDWTNENNVTPESVTLNIFEPSTTSWKSLTTTLSHTDALYYVYEAESGATYGRFAIVGTDKVSRSMITKIVDIIKDTSSNIIDKIDPSKVPISSLDSTLFKETIPVLFISLILIGGMFYFRDDGSILINLLIFAIVLIVVYIFQNSLILQITNTIVDILLSSGIYVSIVLLISYYIQKLE